MTPFSREVKYVAVPRRNRRLFCHVAELPEVKGRAHMHFVDLLGIHVSMKYV